MKFKPLLRIALLLLGALHIGSSAQPVAAASKIRVVTTIKPIHSLVAAIMQGVGVPDFLIKGANSPHSFSLRPSDARLLSRADIVFWIGEDIELPLVKPLASLTRSAHIITLSKIRDLHLLPIRVYGKLKGNEHASHSLKSHSKGRRKIDPHFWLDIQNAVVMTNEIVRQLSLSDQENAKLYAANGAKLSRNLTELQATLTAQLEPVSTQPYMVFHDAFQYFEKQFSLTNVGSVTPSPEHPPGAKRLLEIRKKMTTTNISCLFAEPQFNPAIVHTIVQGTLTRQAALDPIGANIPAGPGAYGELLQGIADSLILCLKQ